MAKTNAKAKGKGKGEGKGKGDGKSRGQRPKANAKAKAKGKRPKAKAKAKASPRRKTFGGPISGRQRNKNHFVPLGVKILMNSHSPALDATKPTTYFPADPTDLTRPIQPDTITM